VPRCDVSAHLGSDAFVDQRKDGLDASRPRLYLRHVSNQARQILEEALRLPVDERADVAAELLRSLDEVESALPQEEVERQWAEEITRRAERAARGESVGRDANEVLNSIESKLRKR
jgi:hypothetical protein